MWYKVSWFTSFIFHPPLRSIFNGKRNSIQFKLNTKISLSKIAKGEFNSLECWVLVKFCHCILLRSLVFQTFNFCMLMTHFLLIFIKSPCPHKTITEQAIQKELPTIKAEARNMNKIFSTQHLFSHQGRHGYLLTKRSRLQTMLLLVLVMSA